MSYPQTLPMTRAVADVAAGAKPAIATLDHGVSLSALYRARLRAGHAFPGPGAYVRRSAERIAQAVALVGDGMPQAVAARACGVDQASVARARRDAGLGPLRRGRPPGKLATLSCLSSRQLIRTT